MDLHYLVDDTAARVENDAVLDDVAGGPPLARAVDLSGGTEDAADNGHRGGAREPHDPHGGRRASGGRDDGGDGAASGAASIGRAGVEALVGAQDQLGLCARKKRQTRWCEREKRECKEDERERERDLCGVWRRWVWRIGVRERVKEREMAMVVSGRSE